LNHSIITQPQYPQTTPASPSAAATDHNPVSERILAALSKTGGNKAKAARILGMDRSTLYRKVRELQIDLDVLKF
jgi:transcriptional regulator of acetoin/glycerol metabolism